MYHVYAPWTFFNCRVQFKYCFFKQSACGVYVPRIHYCTAAHVSRSFFLRRSVCELFTLYTLHPGNIARTRAVLYYCTRLFLHHLVFATETFFREDDACMYIVLFQRCHDRGASCRLQDSETMEGLLRAEHPLGNKSKYWRNQQGYGESAEVLVRHRVPPPPLKP